MKDYTKRYYWIKIKESFMTSDTVDFLISQDGCNGFKYVVLYQLLCLKTVNSNGRLIRQLGEVLVPYDVTKIHREFSKWYKLDEIKKAFELFNELGLIQENDEGIIAIANFDNMVGSETEYAIEKREYRDRKQLSHKDNVQDNVRKLSKTMEKREKESNTKKEERNKILEIRDKILDNREKRIEKDNRKKSSIDDKESEEIDYDDLPF